MRRLAIVTIAALWAACGGATPDKGSERVALQQKSSSTLQEFMAKDASLKALLDRSAGYVVFPEIGKGGFVVGGASGRGVMYQNHQFVGYVKLSQASVGAQVGAQTFAELVVFQDPAKLESIKHNDYTMGGNVSAVVLKSGAGAGADFRDGVAVFIDTHGGAMAEASISGQKLSFGEGG